MKAHPKTGKWQDGQFLQSYHMPLAEIPAYALITAASQGSVVISAPHGGLYYPNDILSLDEAGLRAHRSLEDTGTATIAHALHSQQRSVISSTFCRSLIDLNRPPTALDPLLYNKLPDDIITPKEHADDYAAYVNAGYGVMPRLSATRQPLHKAPIEFGLATKLLSQFYQPYHDRLRSMLHKARTPALLIDIHSMPERVAGKRLPDFIFGDDFGTSLPHSYRAVIDDYMAGTDFRAGWNHPFAGGFITRHYGHRDSQHHSLQIEINRALYCPKSHHISPNAIAQIVAMLEELICRLEQISAKAMAAQ